MRILIADDDIISRRVLEVTLRKWGYDLVVTCDGRQAWEAILEFRPDVLLLDVMLPGVDGFEVCHRLRQEPATAKVPIVLVSAKGRREDVETGLRVGANEYMTKPLSRVNLLATVKKLLEAA